MKHLKIFTSLLVLLLFLTACDDKIVSKYYLKIQSHLSIDSIQLESIYPEIQNKLNQAIKNEKLTINESAKYSIKVDYLNYKKACNNPMTSAYDATFSGFIRLTLLEDSKRIYMCQKEFRGELNVSDFEKLLILMRDDLEF